MDDDIQPDPAASAYGTLLAIGDILRALVATHPDPQSFAEVLRDEYEQTIARLIAKPVREASIDTYNEMVSLVVPPELHPDGPQAG